MKNGKCPSCGSMNVYTKPEGMQLASSTPRERGVYIFTTGLTAKSPIDAYVCADCGYFMNYIADKMKLAEVAQNWTKVQ